MTLRLRLTLLSTATLAALLLLGTAALYLTVSRITLAMLEEAMVADTRDLVDSPWFRPDSVEHRYGPPDGYTSTLFQTRSLDGALLDRSRALGALELPLSERGLAEVRGGTPWSEAVSLEGVRLLVHSRALRKGGQLVGIIQSARSLDEHDRSLAVLTTALAAGAALGSLLAFGSSWLLVGAALRPIDRITQEAAEIGAEQDFTRRVSYAGPSDEVGRLAATINGMLTELHAGYRQVAQALQTQRRFVADASHELRTPLTTVRGNLDLLGREPPITPQDRRAVLRDTVDETQRMMRLVNELLALARGDAGWRPALSSVPVADLLEEVRRQALVMAPTRPVAIAADEGLCVYASRDQLKQVLLILLDNALKHTPAEASVRLTARAEGDGAAISVADTGPGIEPALMPQLFERFFRADGARTGDGAGLGLSIARSLSEAQGGSIAVESRVGEGSVFTVRLNTLAPQPALPWPTATGEGEPETLPPPSPVHVASGGGGQGE